MSVPVVVTVHGNQQCEAEATVFWENAFAEKVRDLFYLFRNWYQKSHPKSGKKSSFLTRRPYVFFFWLTIIQTVFMRVLVVGSLECMDTVCIY